MLIYLSEESLNSLFKVINESSVSGSYDEKVNRLKKSGVLSDSQDFTCHQTLNKVVADETGIALKDKAIESLNKLDKMSKIFKIIQDTRDERLWAQTALTIFDLLKTGEMGKEFFDTPERYKTHIETANLLRELSFKYDEQWGNAKYMEVVDVLLKGTAPLWAMTAIAASKGAFGRDPQEKALALIHTYAALGINIERVAKETSEKLADFFPDGTYNYTQIMFPTVVYLNGDAGNGTCQITSQYEVNTQGLVQKLFNHNYQSSVNNTLPITILQTLDISNNFRYISSLGSSTSGTYIINDNTCTIIDYGYSVASGEFTNFKYTLIKTGIGFISTTYVLNDDLSETLRSVGYYTKV